MKTKYFDIESIVIYDRNNISLASNIMLEGYNYDEPIYTNIFCQKKELGLILKKEDNEVSKNILAKLLEENGKQFQIDIPDIQPNLYSMILKNNYELEVTKKDEIPFTCYNLKLKKNACT